jgi:hypothetical protein
MRRFVLSLAPPFPCPMAAAEIVPLSELSSYLNGIDAAQSTFTQINADGTVSTGEVLHPATRAARGSNTMTTTFW